MDITGYNLGYECIQLQERAFGLCEAKIQEHLTNLEKQNELSKQFSHLVTKLTHAREAKKADFAQDPETMKAIESIYAHSPATFNNHLTFQWNSEREIDSLIHALKTGVKLLVDEINQTTMLLNMRYEERVKYTECALRTLEICIHHNESILSRSAPK